jgi:hypothetical protein
VAPLGPAGPPGESSDLRVSELERQLQILEGRLLREQRLSNCDGLLRTLVTDVSIDKYALGGPYLEVEKSPLVCLERP